MAVLNNKVQLYYEPRYIFINISEPGVPNWNMPMNEIRFKIFKASDNLVQFIVRNNDRKPILLRGKELWITINYEDQYRTLLRKKLRVIDAEQGIAHLILEPWETLNFPLGYLEFNITISDNNQTRMISFDESQNCRGFIEIEQGVFTGPRPSLESCKIDYFRLNDMPVIYRFFSEVFPGTLNTNSYTGLNTAAISLTNYSGRIWTLCSLEKQIPKAYDYGWFDVNLVDTKQPWMDFDNFTGIVNINFICKSYWVLFKFDPIMDINSSNSPIDTSFLNKISFRN